MIHKRQIALDLETTGFYWEKGDRILEIGCVELVNGVITGSVYSTLVRPDTDIIITGEVHGITEADLKDAPTFADICDDFLTFIGDSDLIIHNSGFDTMFIAIELKRLGRANIQNNIIDTVTIARRYHTHSLCSLNKLAKYYNISQWRRAKYHRAIDDAYILAQLFIVFQTIHDTATIMLNLKPIVADITHDIVSNEIDKTTFISSLRSIINTCHQRHTKINLNSFVQKALSVLKKVDLKTYKS